VSTLIIHFPKRYAAAVADGGVDASEGVNRATQRGLLSRYRRWR